MIRMFGKVEDDEDVTDAMDALLEKLMEYLATADRLAVLNSSGDVLFLVEASDLSL